MTKISQYSTDVNITGNDKWIGSDAQNFLITKNFTPNNLANYFNENNVIDIGTSIRYRYQTLLPGEAREQGTISFETEIGPQVNFSAITTFLIAKNSLKQNDVSQYLDFLVDGKVLLSKASNINIFGYYKITSIEPWIPNTNFFVVEVDFLAGNGFIYEDLDYLVSLVDKVQDIPPPVWGSITGDIEDQTDLINYISSQIITPTLVALPFTTDHLAVTNNQYIVGDIVWYLGNVYRCIANNDSIIPTSTLYWTNLGAGYPLVQQPSDWNSTSGNNQILNKPTIPTLTSQLINDVPFLTQDNVVEYPDLASFPATGVIGTIYIALDTGLFYSWSGSAYVLSSPPNTGITGVGTTNYLPKFTSPTTVGNSKVSQDHAGGSVYINYQGRSLLNGNTFLSIQRGQSQIDFVLGNPGFSQPSIIISDNQTDGFEIQSKGEFAIKTGATYANEGLRVLSTGKLKFTQTPDTGATSDKLLVRDTSGNVKQIDYPTGGGIPHGTAAGTDTYTVTISGVTSYADGDAYIIRFTNGNTTLCTLNINSLGAIPLYRNNDGPLLGGDILDGGEMLCIYNSTLVEFQVIGISPNSLIAYVTNDDSVTITKGMPVYAFSGQGDRMTVKRANNTGDATSAQTVGLVLSTSIGVNQKGVIMMQGLLDGLSILPTATWDDGDPVYLGATPGTITNIKPYAPNHLVYLGVVTTASNGAAGRMYVRVQNGYELQELHNVDALNPNNNDGIFYNSTTQLWEHKNVLSVAAERRNANNSTNSSINYCGIAPADSLESASVWTITRLTITLAGAVTTASAINVKWTDRETTIYT